MRINLLTIAALTFVVISCNNGTSEKTENSNTDSTSKMDTAGHGDHHPTVSAEVPALPPIPEGAKVFFKNVKDGSSVTSPLKVEMGVEGMSLDTANGMVKSGSGHHHILIDLDSIPAGMVVPKDSTHLHFGNAQSSAEVKLSPGKHTLTLQYADALHRSYGSKLTSKVAVEVKK